MTKRLIYKFDKNRKADLFIKLTRAMSSLRNPVEMAQFLRDLLSETEVIMLSRRLEIAEMLIDGLSYREIQSNTKTSMSTIAKIQTWLDLYGDGYRTISKRIKKPTKADQQFTGFSKLKRRYPMYYWPELLLQEIIKSANQRSKEKLLAIIDQQRLKSQLHSNILRLLNNQKT